MPNKTNTGTRACAGKQVTVAPHRAPAPEICERPGFPTWTPSASSPLTPGETAIIAGDMAVRSADVNGLPSALFRHADPVRFRGRGGAGPSRRSTTCSTGCCNSPFAPSPGTDAGQRWARLRSGWWGGQGGASRATRACLPADFRGGDAMPLSIRKRGHRLSAGLARLRC